MGKRSYFSQEFNDHSLDRPLGFNGRRNASKQRRELVRDGMNFPIFLPVAVGNSPEPGPPTIIREGRPMAKMWNQTASNIHGQIAAVKFTA